jgi:hypothetical protein
MRPRDVGHRRMMFEAGFFDLKRDRHTENRATVLDRHDASGRETAAIANPVDLVENRNLGVARPEKITLQRMDLATLDGAIRGDEGLANDLAPKDTLRPFLWTSSTEEVELDFFEIEKLDQGLQGCWQWGRLRRSVSAARGAYLIPVQVRDGRIPTERSQIPRSRIWRIGTIVL